MFWWSRPSSSPPSRAPTASPSAQQFTVGCTAIRHTAVTTEQYLPDLVVGLWLGGSERTLQTA